MDESDESELEDDAVEDFLNRIPRRPRSFRRRQQFLYTYSEKEFLRRLRLTKDAFRILESRIGHLLAPSTQR